MSFLVTVITLQTVQIVQVTTTMAYFCVISLPDVIIPCKLSNAFLKVAVKIDFCKLTLIFPRHRMTLFLIVIINLPINIKISQIFSFHSREKLCQCLISSILTSICQTGRDLPKMPFCKKIHMHTSGVEC